MTANDMMTYAQFSWIYVCYFQQPQTVSGGIQKPVKKLLPNDFRFNNSNIFTIIRTLVVLGQ